MMIFNLLFSQFSLKHFYKMSSIPFIQHVNNNCIIFSKHKKIHYFESKTSSNVGYASAPYSFLLHIHYTIYIYTWIFFLDLVFFCLQSMSAACSGWLQDRIIITSEPQPDVLLCGELSSVIARRGSRSQVPVACSL